MTKEIWLNLPVKNVSKSKEFFAKIGFTINEKHEKPDMACVLVGSKNIAVMLFQDSTFKSFTKAEIADAKQAAEICISFDAESKEEVDAMAKKAADAGGTIFGKPEEIQGWMYGCGFADLDGHRWNILYMDMSKMPK
jgi:predicted lactoylglutathione lyase